MLLSVYSVREFEDDSYPLIYIYVYIYIYREREREREKRWFSWAAHLKSDLLVTLHIWLHDKPT